MGMGLDIIGHVVTVQKRFDCMGDSHGPPPFRMKPVRI
jgi:hypothetical protein